MTHTTPTAWSTRPRFRPRQMLTAEQLNTGIDDELLRERLLNRAVHGYGVVLGFAPKVDQDGLLDLDPVFFEAYLEFSAHPWVHGVIPDKVKELLAIAWDASTTHMYEPGLRQHMANALGHGATPAEIMETLELAATIGIQSYETALPILDDEAQRP